MEYELKVQLDRIEAKLDALLNIGDDNDNVKTKSYNDDDDDDLELEDNNDDDDDFEDDDDDDDEFEDDDDDDDEFEDEIEEQLPKPKKIIKKQESKIPPRTVEIVRSGMPNLDDLEDL